MNIGTPLDLIVTLRRGVTPDWFVAGFQYGESSLIGSKRRSLLSRVIDAVPALKVCN